MNKIVKPALGFLFLVGLFLVLRHLHHHGYLHLEHIKKMMPKPHSPEDEEKKKHHEEKNKEKDGENKDDKEEKLYTNDGLPIENHMHDYLIGDKIM